MNRYESILKDVGLKRTDIRLRMLNIFMNSEIALSHHDVCEQLGDGYDKVTVYRNIYTFVKAPRTMDGGKFCSPSRFL